MQIITLDGRNMDTIQSAHAEIAKKLSLPHYYGKNLDALYDVLTTVHSDIEIRLIHCEAMLNPLESYGAKLLMTFFDASAENGRVRFDITPGDGE